jgi:C1A family cysteine protease
MTTKNRLFNISPSPIQSINQTYPLKQIRLKDEIDLRDTDSEIDDQGYLGSCAASATINVYENMLNRFRRTDFEELSRLFLYYNTRAIEETINIDYGVIYLSNVLESLKTLGVCKEELWPYNISNFVLKPLDNCYEDALTRKIENYEYISDIAGIKEVLNLYKPVVIGMHVFENFMSANKRNFKIFNPKNTERYLGGHAVSIVGYTKDDSFIIKNSFGESWGNYGYGLLTKEYMEKYVFDRWHLAIENKEKGLTNMLYRSSPLSYSSILL